MKEEEPKGRGAFQDKPVTKLSMLCMSEACEKQDPGLSGNKEANKCQNRENPGHLVTNLLGTDKPHTDLFFCVWRRTNSSSF